MGTMRQLKEDKSMSYDWVALVREDFTKGGLKLGWKVDWVWFGEGGMKGLPDEGNHVKLQVLGQQTECFGYGKRAPAVFHRRASSPRPHTL